MHVHPLPASPPTRRTYFRYFKVDLWRDCPFWPEDGQCHLRNCAVCECDPHEVPACWDEGGNGRGSSNVSSARSAPLSAVSGASRNADLGAIEEYAAALSRVDFGGADVGSSFRGWELPSGVHADGVWTVEGTTAETKTAGDDSSALSSSLRYVNLLKNPEGYTGYAGPSAQRVWAAVYDASCLGAGDGGCFEERVFYRVVSGLQTSINTHIAMTYGRRGEGAWNLDVLSVPSDGGGGRAGGELAALVLTPGLLPNVDLYVDRIGRHPERLHNLYFAFLFVTRALARAAPALLAADLTTGDAVDDAATARLVSRLVAVEAPAVLAGFDERALFRVTADDVAQRAAARASCAVRAADVLPVDAAVTADADLAALIAEKTALRGIYRAHFRNISRVLDCVGCEKCRLWGKLQFLGLGTAIRILIGDEETDGADVNKVPALSRNELVALINVLHRLSMSLAAIEVFRELEAARFTVRLATSAVVALVVPIVVMMMRRRRSSNR